MIENKQKNRKKTKTIVVRKPNSTKFMLNFGSSKTNCKKSSIKKRAFDKMGVKMNLRIITKNHTADPEIGFLTKSI